jgi:tRNA threonylcarbamoyladenosine dehydratase
MTVAGNPAATPVTALSPEDYYTGLVAGNGGILSTAQQAALSRATVLVAGCGSLGGAVIQPLARMGVRRFLVADPDRYLLANLNRQDAVADDIGRCKAEVAAGRVLAVNPFAYVEAHPEGVTANNVSELTAACQVIIDGIDVTTVPGLRAIVALHETAALRRLPLITGWDLAGTVYTQFFDYRRIADPFDGALSAADLDRLTVWELIGRLLPLRRIPADMLAELNANISRPGGYSVPQVAYTANLAGAIAAYLVAKVLAGEPIRDKISIDIHQAARPVTGRLAAFLAWPREAVRMRRVLARHRRRVDLLTRSSHSRWPWRRSAIT